MSHLSDLHNFGRSVTVENEASEKYFRKPRPLFWEWLFFGSDSPLADIFKDAERTLRTGTEVRDSIFGLTVRLTESGHSGLSQEIKPAHTNGPPSEKSIFHFGALLAYSYTFGIRDLHKSNIIRTDTGLQVIDAEVVFAKLLLPNETLLLSFKEYGIGKSGAGHYFSRDGSIGVPEATTIIRGFLYMLRLIELRRDAVASVINSLSKTSNLVPIRHLLRNTLEYTNSDLQGLNPPLLSEERVQLERGDVPYFFKFLGKKTVFYYTDAQGKYSPVGLPTSFQNQSDREGTSPAELLTQERLRGHLAPVGTLFLLRHLFPRSWDGQVIFDDGTEASITTKDLSLKLPWGNFQSSR